MRDKLKSGVFVDLEGAITPNNTSFPPVKSVTSTQSTPPAPFATTVATLPVDPGIVNLSEIFVVVDPGKASIP